MSDDKSESFEVESEWSECEIFSADLDEMEDNLQQQNETNPADRQVNIDEILESKKKELRLAQELLKHFGSLAVVMLHRSTRYGSLFDKDLFKVITKARGCFEDFDRPCFPRSIINFFGSQLLRGVEDSLTILKSRKKGADQDLTSTLPNLTSA